MTPTRRAPRPQRVHGEVAGDRTRVFAAVHDLVRSIPPGRVMTYGQISILLGSRISPVAVGWAMHGCPEDVPWHRVLNASGRCSTDRLGELPVGVQRALLESEGVTFDLTGAVDLPRYRWTPPLDRP